MVRPRWNSRMIFIFAAVGSAVGLGNVWRFPYLAGKYGGGAFLIPYIVMLVVMGIPLLMMEFAIGQRMQLGASGSFGKINHMLSSIGFGAVLCGFVVVSYYAVIMAWSLLYFKFSFSLAWGQQTAKFFTEDVIRLSSSPFESSTVVTSILAALVVVWFFDIFFYMEGD